ncbi:MAG TPA: hypothetical protein VG345_10305 [Bryobacteraceae bacterium]|nr:hypothetical protein [Bryobacteraceae bacterium]
MNHTRCITIKRAIRGAIAGGLLALSALAHGGLEHVMGTVSKVAGDMIVVHTAANKDVELAVTPKTAFTRSGHAIPADDLKPGSRVVIHASHEGGKLTAVTVQIGVSNTAAARH